jgi:hypothetical protein
MDIYQIEDEGKGWFCVAITAPSGKQTIQGRFVSRRAAQKWIDKNIKRDRQGTSPTNGIAPS